MLYDLDKVGNEIIDVLVRNETPMSILKNVLDYTEHLARYNNTNTMIEKSNKVEGEKDLVMTALYEFDCFYAEKTTPAAQMQIQQGLTREQVKFILNQVWEETWMKICDSYRVV